MPCPLRAADTRDESGRAGGDGEEEEREEDEGQQKTLRVWTFGHSAPRSLNHGCGHGPQLLTGEAFHVRKNEAEEAAAAAQAEAEKSPMQKNLQALVTAKKGDGDAS